MVDTKNAEEVVPVVIDEAPAGVLEEGALDPVYEAKARVLNKAVQDIGMGKYQWEVRLLSEHLLSHMVRFNCTVYANSQSCSS
jgi:hypothetical protein